MTKQEEIRKATVQSLLDARKKLAWSPARTARVDRELARLGHKWPDIEQEDKSKRAEEIEPEKKQTAVPAKRAYTKRS